MKKRDRNEHNYKKLYDNDRPTKTEENKGRNEYSMTSAQYNEEELPQDNSSGEEGNDEENTSETKYELDTPRTLERMQTMMALYDVIYKKKCTFSELDTTL